MTKPTPTSLQVLVVEDDEIMRVSLEDRLRLDGIAARSAASLTEAQRCLTEGWVDLVVTDVRLPDGSGRELFERIATQMPGIPVIVMTAFGSIPEAVDMVKAGAVEYLTKPFELSAFVATVQRMLAKLGGEDSGALGRSAAITRVERLARRIAPLDSSVLITGESGVGKEVVADLIHRNSRRAAAPFVKVNCAAIPLALVESELFGHEKGAFTGADRRRAGRFEQAQGGTIFLDEIAETPLEVQVKLLRVLQERTLERVGGSGSVALDVRIIAATQVDLGQALEHGRFRSDLYWRLNVIHIEVPPLRDRQDDILFLAQRFVAAHATAMGKRVAGLSREAERQLLGMRFPGNVRELKNLLERAVALCEGAEVQVHDLLPFENAAAETPAQRAGLPLRAAMDGAERDYICRVLDECSWGIGRAAEALGISRKSLWEKMRRYGIEHR